MRQMEMEEYAGTHTEELLQLIRELCVVPAPSGQEEKRSRFLMEWMKQNGIGNAFTDSAGNVIWPYFDDGKCDLIAFCAHMDVVFPDMDALPFQEDGKRFHAPGVGDNTACLASMLTAAKFFHDRCLKAKQGLLLIADTGEEGLGNLKGCRAFTDRYRSRLKGVIAVDGALNSFTTKAVGSHRYQITARTEGGHSYNAFGNLNAIAETARLITALYGQKLPDKEGTKTTYNAGVISGGTTINSIAAETKLLYEYRSDDKDCLMQMEKQFYRLLAENQKEGLQLSAERIGERPCGTGWIEGQAELTEKLLKAAEDALGLTPDLKAGSTDINYPLSLGIPAVCIGAGMMGNTHRRDEYLEIDSVGQGLRFLLRVLSDYFITEDQ